MSNRVSVPLSSLEIGEEFFLNKVSLTVNVIDSLIGEDCVILQVDTRDNTPYYLRRPRSHLVWIEPKKHQLPLFDFDE